MKSRRHYSSLQQPPAASFRRLRLARISTQPFCALEILKGGDHRAIGIFRHAFRQPIFPRDRSDLGEDRLHPRRSADRARIGLETSSLGDVTSALGYQPEDVAVEPIDIGADLAEV